MDWYHELTGPNLLVGKAKRNTWFEGANADVGLVDLNPPPADNNNIYVGGSVPVRNVVLIMTNASTIKGSFLCRMGFNSGRDCGVIVDRDETMPSPAWDGGPVRNIDHQVLVNFDSVGGDSGGPYFSDTTGAAGYGLHTHSLDPGDPGYPLGWFSTLEWAKSTYESRTGIVYVYCVTDAC